MFRTHTCGELRISDVNKQVTLSGWVQRSRKMGGMTFIDLRDRYGITQLVFNEEVNAELCERANKLGREFVIQVTGTVNERFSKNANIPTGDIEIIVSELNVPIFRIKLAIQAFDCHFITAFILELEVVMLITILIIALDDRTFRNVFR